jgi:methylated-DNA-[protein]-cysteine S-methyltransferase
MVYVCEMESPLGKITAAAEGDAVAGLWFAGQKYYPKNLDFASRPDNALFEKLKAYLLSYFSGSKEPVPFSLSPRGTAFQQRVWEILREIPYGETTTYGAIAKKIASERKLPSFSAQAVGGAVGRNPISLLIPCHRVIGANQSLTGYAGGLEKKRFLLALEQKNKSN